jgi:hypothetical protein
MTDFQTFIGTSKKKRVVISQFCTDVWKEVVIIVESSFFVEEHWS